MAKWIYEKWQPRWPEATGFDTFATRGEEVDVFEFSGSSTKENVENLSPGAVICSSRNLFYLKTDISTRSIRPFDPADVFPTPIKDTLLGEVTLEEGSVPDDGVHSDNFYYMKIKKAFPTLTIGGQVIGGARYKDAQGVERAVGNVYFKDASGVVRTLK